MKEQKHLQLMRLIEGVSHELRTPIGAILGYTELLEKSKNLGETEKDHLARITENSRYLLDVVNDLIQISGMESGEVKLDQSPVTISGLEQEMKETYFEAARLQNIELTVSGKDDADAEFFSDEKRIKTILKNLVDNALKFTKGGSVEILFSLVDSANISNEYEFGITVKDSGVGISEGDLSRIFSPLWQAQKNEYPGAGLGLTICKKLVKFMGGEIKVESIPGEGTTVKVQIPVLKTKNSSASISVRKDKAEIRSAGKLKALVVDDLPINRTVARIMLERNNFEIIEASNGLEALDFYRGYKPNLVLMDISMPMMDGIEAMERIRQINGVGEDLPIIAITAGGHINSRNELIGKGFSEYIQKPFERQELLEKIGMFLPLAHLKSQPGAFKA